MILVVKMLLWKAAVIVANINVQKVVALAKNHSLLLSAYHIAAQILAVTIWRMV